MRVRKSVGASLIVALVVVVNVVVNMVGFVVRDPLMMALRRRGVEAVILLLVLDRVQRRRRGAVRGVLVVAPVRLRMAVMTAGVAVDIAIAVRNTITITNDSSSPQARRTRTIGARLRGLGGHLVSYVAHSLRFQGSRVYYEPAPPAHVQCSPE